MNSSIASFVFACGIAGLFYLNRDPSLRSSKALWIPVIWISLVGSRPISAWLDIGPSGGNAQLDGSPVDASIFAVLSLAAIVVLVRRSKQTRELLAANLPILIYFSYCLITVAWSFHPDVAFKRWIKALGDLAMVLVIVTEPRVGDALSRLFSRVGFVLLPASVLLIKYYGNLGRGYTPDGAPMNTGVTTNKNMLGVMVLVISLGTLWRFMTILREKNRPDRRRLLCVQGLLLLNGIVLLKMANSATSSACFALGSTIMLITGLRPFRRQPTRVHILSLGLVLGGALMVLFGGASIATSALGRNSDLTGRTDIWAAAIKAAGNPLFGTGFESFWISPNEQIFWHILDDKGWWNAKGLNEAHNGYLEVYLNLGWIGVCLIAFILVTGYARAFAAFRRNPHIGGLMLAYVIASAIYSITEAGFRMMDPIWIFLLLAVVGASGVAVARVRSQPRKVRIPWDDTSAERPSGAGLIPQTENL